MMNLNVTYNRATTITNIKTLIDNDKTNQSHVVSDR